MPKISELPSGIPTTVDSLPLVQGSTTKKATFNDLPIAAATQTALNLKADANNPIFTGTVTGVSKAAVGLGNVDNTSDVNKPVSTAQTAALQTATSDRVSGLVGAPNGATPLTKYDLQAAAVTLRNLTGAPITRLNTATLTCDLGLAGSSANGRDQAGAFAINSWVYLYFIWNGTTLATLASTTVPASFTGSTLPSGYTHWAFATAVRWNASSNIVPMRTQGSATWYDLADGSARALVAGTASTMTAVSCATLIPPIAMRGVFIMLVSATAASVSVIQLKVRPTGAANAGVRGATMAVQVAGTTGESQNTMELPLGTSTQIDYLLTGTVSSGGAYIDVAGFIVPNGDV